jgi:DNA-binding NarL/FixJ family response regulator
LKEILICEDHQIVFDGLQLLLASNSDYKIAGHAATGKELLPLLRKSKPAILILDLNLPDTDGISLLKLVRKEDARIKTIILTMYYDSELIEKARNAGANAYLLKNTGNKELMVALDKVFHTEFHVTESMRVELDQKKMFSDQFAQKMKLTLREVEIMRWLCMGKTSQEIAETLFLSPLTVETHRKNIFRKLEINNIGKLVRFAHDNNLL